MPPLWIARLVTPIVWRLPGHPARKLAGFSRAEQGSRLDLLLAARRSPSLARRAAYIRHALDETRHASMFYRRADELRRAAGRPAWGPPRADCESLYDRLGELGFLAFVHRGERRGREQFELYRDHFARRGDERTRGLFAAILEDETRHERYTRALLIELAGGEAPARRALSRAAAWGAWRAWRRAGRATVRPIFAVAMLIIYVLVMPFGWLGARLARGKRSAGLLPP
jgi:hypothetical protein